MKCILLSEDDFYSAHQEVIIFKYKESLTHVMRVSTPQIISDQINFNSTITSVKEIIFNHKLINGIESKSNVLNSNGTIQFEFGNNCNAR